MTPGSDLLDRLERELHALPPVPADVYLRAGRRARHRRRAVAAVLTGAIVVGTAQLLAPGGGREASIAEDPVARDHVGRVAHGPDPDYLAPAPNNPVQAVEGLDGVDWFTTEDVPAWAQEYGNHGPVALAPDGRLWVAPDAEVSRTVIDPYPRGEHGVTASYAVEARWASAPDDIGDGLVWVVIATDGTGPGAGEMDTPGRWTDDFELWVDDATARLQRRPSVAERLLRFADGTTSRVLPGADGVEVLREQRDPDLGPEWVQHSRATAAEVVHGGVHWYVMAVDPSPGAAWYQVYPVSTADDFDAFVDLVEDGWVE